MKWGFFWRLVLIGTLWNVNELILPDSCRDEGFNRYIVECKFYQKGIPKDFRQCFNRYIVECK